MFLTQQRGSTKIPKQCWVSTTPIWLSEIDLDSPEASQILNKKASVQITNNEILDQINTHVKFTNKKIKMPKQFLITTKRGSYEIRHIFTKKSKICIHQCKIDDPYEVVSIREVHIIY